MDSSTIESLASKFLGSTDLLEATELCQLDMDGALIHPYGRDGRPSPVKVITVEDERTAPNGRVIRGVIDFTIYADELERRYSDNARVQRHLRGISYDDHSITKLYTRDDVEIIVYCHMLIAGSLYFDGALRGFFVESQTAQICLDDIAYADLIAYLKMAHQYFFLRLSEAGMPSGGLFDKFMKRINHKVLDVTGFQVPCHSFSSALSAVVLADRFLTRSLFIFTRQVFLRLLATTKECWIHNKIQATDFNHKYHQAFVTNYLDAYKILCRCADEDKYLRNALMESFHDIWVLNDDLRNAMNARLDALGEDGQAFREDWLNFQLPLSGAFIEFDEDGYLCGQAFHAACQTTVIKSMRNKRLAWFKDYALDELKDAQQMGKQVTVEVIWNTVAALATGRLIPIRDKETTLSAEDHSALPTKLEALAIADEGNNNDDYDVNSVHLNLLHYILAVDEAPGSVLELDECDSEASEVDWVREAEERIQSLPKLSPARRVRDLPAQPKYPALQHKPGNKGTQHQSHKKRGRKHNYGNKGGNQQQGRVSKDNALTRDKDFEDTHANASSSNYKSKSKATNTSNRNNSGSNHNNQNGMQKSDRRPKISPQERQRLDRARAREEEFNEWWQRPAEEDTEGKW